jgi:signal transduction histidine kinase
MRILLKTIIVCCLTAILAIGASYSLFQSTVIQNANASEIENAKTEVEHVQKVFSFEFSQLSIGVADWANWDDTYQFVEDNNTNYILANLVPSAIKDLELNLMMFANSTGTVIMQMTYNFTTTNMNFDSTQIRQRYPNLFQPEAHNNFSEGIIKLNEGLMLVVSAPILTSNYQGPPRGTAIFGRFLDETELAKLSEISGMPVDMCRLDSSEMDSNFLWANNTLSPEKNVVTKTINDTSTAGYSLVEDLNGNPVSLLQVTIPRSDYEQSMKNMFYVGLSSSLIGLILVVLITLLLYRFVLVRLSKLTKKVKRLSLKDETLTPFTFHGSDEISELAKKINEMIQLINESQLNLKEYSSNLELKVAEKTKDLVEAQTKLIQAERFSVIGQMAATVGHDLRNPLFGIATSVNYLRKTSSKQMDENGRKMLDFVDRNLEGANKILNDLLDYSREIKLEKEVIKLDALINCSLLSSRVPETIKVTNEIDKSLEVTVDSAKINRVFINLITNAVDSMPNGGSLTIQSFSSDREVHVKFTDTGTGISPENIDKIMKPLFTTKTKGIGLGLVICKRFVEAHGGTIKVTSEKDKGTSFIISLPTSDHNIIQEIRGK